MHEKFDTEPRILLVDAVCYYCKAAPGEPTHAGGAPICETCLRRARASRPQP